jgi:uncharacterized protein (DUF2235 family)
MPDSSSSNNYSGHAQEISTAETLVNGGVSYHSDAATKSTITQEQSLDFTAAVHSKVVPPENAPRNRTLVLCFDGTGDQFDADNSNIVQLFSMLTKNDRSKQMVYYQAGVGTYASPQIVTPFVSKLAKIVDEMIAWSLDAHVMYGYEFLMENYIAGDRICIFGFSRGAYTARALAGMLHKVGLLPAGNFQQVPFAYKIYSQADETGWKQSSAFKSSFSIDVDIEFIGVWDTVNSVGLIPRCLPFTTSNTIVRTFRHALSLDEHRVKFKANLWNRPNANEAQLGDTDTIHPPSRLALAMRKRGSSHQDSEDDFKLHTFEDRYGGKSPVPTDVREVWFAGCHSDVGGGSVTNETPHSLARISLRWMIRECFRTHTGIMFDTERLRGIGLDPTTLYPLPLPVPPPLSTRGSRIGRLALPWLHFRSASAPPKTGEPTIEQNDLGVDSHDSEGVLTQGSEVQEELHDAMAPLYDQLHLNWAWWLLELLPMKDRYQKSDNTWVSTFGCNLGQPRFIPHQKVGLLVHRSVKMRMETEFEGEPGKRYKPRASFSVEPTWVD